MPAILGKWSLISAARTPLTQSGVWENNAPLRAVSAGSLSPSSPSEQTEYGVIWYFFARLQ